MRERRIPACHPASPHQGRGLCKPCYLAAYRRGQLPTRRNKRSDESIWDVIASRSIHQPNGCIDYPVEHATYPALDGRQLNRLVLERKIGRPIREGLLAIHSCDRPQCINPDHLSEGTYQDNANDMLARGRFVLGARVPRPLKLTARDVLAIRAATIVKRSPTHGVNALAGRYGVTIGMIWKIRHGKAWAHLDHPHDGNPQLLGSAESLFKLAISEA